MKSTKIPWNKGLTKLTDNRLLLIGRKVSKSRKGIVPWNKGKLNCYSSEQLERMTSANRLIHQTVQYRLNMKLGKAGQSKGKNNPCYGKFGAAHPAWKGEKSKGYLRFQIYGSSKYKKWRNDVFKRDNYICRHCNCHSSRLEAHHIKLYSEIMKNIYSYDEAMNCNELWDINNGLTLCRKCHKLTFVFCGNQHLVSVANRVNSEKVLT